MPTYDEAKENYQKDNGAAIRLPTSAVDFSKLDLSEAPQIQQAIKNNTNAKTGDVFVIRWRSSRDNLAYETVGDQYKTLGDISIKVVGYLSKKNNGWWFSGNYKPFDDYYNFDFQWSKPVRSVLTIGADIDHGAGTPYWHEFQGRNWFYGYINP